MSATLASPPLRWPTKDPGDKLDYALDASPFLTAPVGNSVPDTLANAVWTVPEGLVKEDEYKSGTFAVVWLSGGAPGTEYSVNCLLTTQAGRKIDRSVLLLVAEL